MTFRCSRLLAACSLPLTLALLPGCGKEVVRGANDPSIDAHALFTSLPLQGPASTGERARTLRRPRRAWPPRTLEPTPDLPVPESSTSEHIDSMLDAMLSETESWLVDAQVVRVVSRERQNQMIREVEGQQNAVFNPAHAAKYGKQLGVLKYFITGKVSGNDERTEDMRRVQYFLFLQVIDVETSEIRWQRKTYVTKAVK